MASDMVHLHLFRYLYENADYYVQVERRTVLGLLSIYIWFHTMKHSLDNLARNKEKSNS